MNKSDILECLYDMLPDEEADNYITLILSDEDSIEKALSFLIRKGVILGNDSRDSFFSKVKEKPVYKTVKKFMAGDLEDKWQIMKMLSSIVTQILIQCELRGLHSSSFNISQFLGLICDFSEHGDKLDNDLIDEAKSVILELGWNDNE